MNYSIIVALINKHVRGVKASYENPQENPRAKETLFKALDPTLIVGDICVVPSTTRHGYTTVKITHVDVPFDFDSTEKIEWIVQRVDIGAHQSILAQESVAVSEIQAAEENKKREELTASLAKNHSALLGKLSIAHLGDAPAAE